MTVPLQLFEVRLLRAIAENMITTCKGAKATFGCLDGEVVAGEDRAGQAFYKTCPECGPIRQVLKEWDEYVDQANKRLMRGLKQS